MNLNQQNQESLINDICNLFQILVNEILYCLQIYPSYVFEQKNVFGTLINVTKKSSLSDYLDEMFAKIKNLFLSDTINCISIILKNNNNIIEKFDLKFEKQIALNILEHFPQQFERDIYFKKIIMETQQQVQKNQHQIFSQNQLQNSFEIQIISNNLINIDGQYQLIEDFSIQPKQSLQYDCKHVIDLIQFAEFSIIITKLKQIV